MTLFFRAVASLLGQLLTTIGIPVALVLLMMLALEYPYIAAAIIAFIVCAVMIVLRMCSIQDSDKVKANQKPWTKE